jgi:hypothetical protein
VDHAGALIPRAWVTDVAAVVEHAEPAMSALAGDVIVTPTFMSSSLVGGADGDLIIGPSLVEVKATKRTEAKGRSVEPRRSGRRDGLGSRYT